MRFFADIQRRIAADRELWHGVLEIRLSDPPINHTLWVADGRTQYALVHISLFWRTPSTEPSFRASRKESAALVDNVASEFDALWASGKPYNATSP